MYEKYTITRLNMKNTLLNQWSYISKCPAYTRLPVQFPFVEQTTDNGNYNVYNSTLIMHFILQLLILLHIK